MSLGRELRVMGGGRVRRGGSSAELALRRLGLCKLRCRWRAAGIASIDGQFCSLYHTSQSYDPKASF